MPDLYVIKDIKKKQKSLLKLNEKVNVRSNYRKTLSSLLYPSKLAKPKFANRTPNPIIPNISGQFNNRKQTPQKWAPTNSASIRIGTESYVA